jgi:hypothetical protein
MAHKHHKTIDSAGRLVSPLRRAAARRNIVKARHAWMAMSEEARRKAMPPHKFKGMSEEEIREELKKEHKRYISVGGFLTKDVGRPKHHYIVTEKLKWGWKKPKFVTQEYLAKKMAKARHVWMRMSHAARVKAMPGRKHRKGYHEVPITEHRHGHIIHSHAWEKNR